MKKILFLFAAVVLINGCKGQEINTLVFNNAKISSERESRIDSIVSDAIKQKAMPGCRILASVNHYVFFDKCYGYFTYDSIQKVDTNTVYDLASITKIAASSLVLMKLYENGKIGLDLPLTDYFKGITDNGATLRDALAHQAGFKSWIDLKRLNKDLSRKILLSPEKYNDRKARKQITEQIVKQPLADKGNYLYSDLGFYLYTLFPKKFYGKDFDEFLYDTFYRPLGLKICFNPNKELEKNIPPTEKDSLWRKTIVKGKVHDEGAYLMGGVSGHAGLFSSAKDLAVLMQMLLDKGSYGGKFFFRPQTVELFTSQAFEGNRRGLVFDKPVIDSTLNGTPSKMASQKSFGHTGFTGGFVWADPDNGLLFVFLTNSTFPKRGTMLSKLDVRTKIHDEMYNAVKTDDIIFSED